MQAYNEQLAVPASWWWLAAGSGFVCAIMLLPVGPMAAVVAFAVGAALAAWLLFSYGSVRLRVTDAHLEAGRARLPLGALGDATVLDREAARALRMEDADPRAFMLLRSYVPTAVRVDVVDPDDPTPYLYLSTRNPTRVAEILDALRRRDAPRS
ncbi:DUF3093 domain-containing protein [Yinghuangia sp. ASG 101]|uniref:DUF3093 domain-containing protein n=1 Tax=Yinghuangia sp. ASG 101 TaxID=2896848 RepID=UPI001E3AE1CA|nr:DUF3093 domain-containing protein [Yinghuangia sp. ASG 101]UGQ13854.1 DUF3093 domain-containing protein [Yinghuangia sp. ASG 101]